MPSQGVKVNSVGEEGMGLKGAIGEIVILASYKVYFINVYDNLVQDPSTNKSICLVC